MPNIGPFELVVLAVLLAFLVAWVGALVVSAMKDQWAWFVLGILFAPLAFVGLVASAKPGSAWARR